MWLLFSRGISEEKKKVLETMKRGSSSNVFDLVGNTALYEVLGLVPSASEKDIRRAFYRIAVVYHPDKNPDGEEIFKEVSFAYNILSDPNQKRMYDAQTLRSHLQGRAQEYNPEMDPTVELSPDDLRKFVDRLKKESDAKKEQVSAFELRREEEIKRRAEYDAKQPGFKAEYERQRDLRKQRAALQVSAKREEPLALATGLRFRTCAEMVGVLQEEDTRRRMGERLSSPTRPSEKLVNMKEDLLRQYRAGELRGGGENRRVDGGGNGADNRALTTRRDNPEFVQRYEEQAGATYSASVDDTLRKYKNYDYLDAVVNNKEDKLEINGAILADALSLYDKKN